MADLKRVYVPARIQTNPGAILVTDAAGVEQPVARAGIAIVDGHLCLIADYIRPAGGDNHVVRLDGELLVVRRCPEWQYEIDATIGA